MVLIEGSSGIVGILAVMAVAPVLTFIFETARALTVELAAGFDLDAAGRGRCSVEVVSEEGAEASAYPSQEPLHFKQLRHDGLVSSHLTCRFLEVVINGLPKPSRDWSNAKL